MWNRFEPRSRRDYPRQNSLRSNERAAEVEEHEAHLSGQEQQGAYATVSNLSSDHIRRGASGSTSHFLTAPIPQAARSQRSVSRGKLPAERDAPLQAELPSSSAVEAKPPNLPIWTSQLALERISGVEYDIFKLFYEHQNILIPMAKLTSDFNQLTTRISRLNSSLLEKGHVPIVLIRNLANSENPGLSYVWEGLDAPIVRKKLGVVLRRYSLIGKEPDGKDLALGLREEEFLLLSDLIAKTGLGVSRCEIVDILNNANIDAHDPGQMIALLRRRIGRLGLTITSEGARNTIYRLRQSDGGASSA